MSDSGFEDSQYPGWLDLKSDLPRNSSVDSTIILGVNVSFHSADRTQTRALVHRDSNIAGPACNRGTSVSSLTYQGKGQDPIKGRNFLSPHPKRTPKASHRPFSRFAVGCRWVEGERWGEGGPGGEKLYTMSGCWLGNVYTRMTTGAYI